MDFNDINDLVEELNTWCNSVLMPRSRAIDISEENKIAVDKIDEYMSKLDVTMSRLYFMRIYIITLHGKHITPVESKIFDYLISKLDKVYNRFAIMYNDSVSILGRIRELLDRGFSNVPENVYGDVDKVLESYEAFRSRVENSILPSFRQMTELRCYDDFRDVVNMRYSEVLYKNRKEYFTYLIPKVKGNTSPDGNYKSFKLEVVTRIWKEAFSNDNKDSYVNGTLYNKITAKARFDKTPCYMVFVADDDGDVHYVDAGGFLTDYNAEASEIYGEDSLKFIIGVIKSRYTGYLISTVKLNNV